MKSENDKKRILLKNASEVAPALTSLINNAEAPFMAPMPTALMCRSSASPLGCAGQA